MVKLYWFPNPNSFLCVMKVDITGVVVTAHVATHPTGRVGQVFDLPDNTFDETTGASIDMTLAGYEDMSFRGILNKSADGFGYINIDDVHGIKKVICPEVPPIPPPNTNPDPSRDPFLIIKKVYSTGTYDLNTKDGCGRFTEDACTALHEQHSKDWGHLKKIPPQNHYPEQPYVPGGNVHAVDVVQLLVATLNTRADVYDIIANSESFDAEVTFNSKGPCIPELWYYPA